MYPVAPVLSVLASHVSLVVPEGRIAEVKITHDYTAALVITAREVAHEDGPDTWEQVKDHGWFVMANEGRDYIVGRTQDRTRLGEALVEAVQDEETVCARCEMPLHETPDGWRDEHGGTTCTTDMGVYITGPNLPHVI